MFADWRQRQSYRLNICLDQLSFKAVALAGTQPSERLSSMRVLRTYFHEILPPALSVHVDITGGRKSMVARTWEGILTLAVTLMILLVWWHFWTLGLHIWVQAETETNAFVSFYSSGRCPRLPRQCSALEIVARALVCTQAKSGLVGRL